MEFKNGYNFLYQKAKSIYASKIGRPNTDDGEVDFGLTDDEKKNIKLVYENKNGLVVNFTGLPTIEDKNITAMIDGEEVFGPAGEPTGGALHAFKAGDKFIDFHFDTTKILTPDDFSWDYEGDGKLSILAAYSWDQAGDGHDIDDNAIAAQYIQAGEIEGLDEDLLMIINFYGYPIYISNAEIAKIIFEELADLIDHDGWYVGSLKEFIEKYDLDWSPAPPAFGTMLSEIPDDVDFSPNYNQVANGTIYGFLDEDYYKVPQPTTSLYSLKKAEYLFEEIVFDTTKTLNINDFATEGSREDEPKEAAFFHGTLHFDGSTEEGTSDIVGLQDFSNLEFDGFNFPDNSFMIGWGEGCMFPIYISNQYLLDALKQYESALFNNAVVGWNGSNLREAIPASYASLVPEGAVYRVSGTDSNENVWNGKLIGASVDKEEYQPVINMREIEVGDSASLTIQFDTTKEADLLNLLENLNYNDNSYQFFGVGTPGTSGNLNPLVAVRLDDNKYIIAAYKSMNDSELTVVYSTFTGRASAAGGSLSVYKGFNNLTKDGCLTFEWMQSWEVLTVRDPNSQWNGNLIGTYLG